MLIAHKDSSCLEYFCLRCIRANQLSEKIIIIRYREHMAENETRDKSRAVDKVKSKKQAYNSQQKES